MVRTIEQNKKRGPKPRHGKNKPSVRKSLSVPEYLWDWCSQQALFDETSDGSVSAYIVKLIARERKRVGKAG